MARYKKRLLTVFIVLFVCSLTIFMLLTTILFSFNQKKNYEDAISNSTISKLTNAQLSLSIMKRSFDEIVINSIISEWANNRNDSEYYYTALKAKQEMQKITANLELIEYDVAITLADEESFVITPISTYSKIWFFGNETDLAPDQIEEFYNHFVKEDQSSPLTLVSYENGKINNIYYFVERRISDRKLVYVLYFSADTVFLNSEKDNLILFDSNGVIAYQGNINNTDELYEDIFFDKASKVEGKSNLFKISYDNGLAYIGHFNSLGWTAAYFYKDFTKEILKSIFILSIPFALLIMAAVGIAKLITDRLYSPIKEVLHNFDEEDSSEALDEFEVIQRNTRKMKEINEQLEELIEEKETFIKQRLYRDLLFGVDIEFTSQKVQYSEKPFCVALIELNDTGSDFINDEIVLAKNQIHLLSQHDPTLQYVNIHHNICAIIIQIGTVQKAKNTLNDFMRKINTNIDYKIALSNVVAKIDDIHKCLKEAERILEYKYLYGKNTILTYKAIEALDETIYYYPLMLEEKIIKFSIEGKKEALDLFDDLIRENIGGKNLTPETLKNFIFSIIATIQRIFQELKISPSDLIDNDINFIELYDNWNNVNIIKILRDIFVDIIEKIKFNNSKTDKKMLDEMLHYIHTNYSDDIMLSEMAESLNISPKYCSALFKKLFNDNFKNYLNSYRIEKAKEIINKNPNIKIITLSEMVGFNSASSFIRVFNKYEGETPKTYAERFIKK